jgi:4-amino-4-deoxy-L-arabinose transferase-like glycosyltransferase
MFFVIVFAHVSLRRGMAAEEIFYLEYFYFITYMMILWVAINSILYFKMKHVVWLQHEENLILKLMFWPVVTGFLFVTSVATFY